MRAVLALLLALLLLPTAPAAAQEQTPVVVVGIAGLRWDDVTETTPVLQRLARRSAVGVLSVKALPPVSCRADGWLTLGAGTRAEHIGGGELPCEARLPDDLDRQRQRNANSRDGAVLGALVTTLDGAVQLQGDGSRVAAGLPHVVGESAPPVAGPAPLLRLIDGGTLSAVDRSASLAAVERQLAAVVADVGDDTDLIVIGLSEGAGESEAHLHVAMATGPTFPRGALRSASTRRAPYVQLIDVAPTVLDRLGREVPESMDGQPWRVVEGSPAVAELVDLDRRAVEGKRASVPFFVAYLALLAVALGAARRRPRALRLVALTGAAVPVASYLAMLVPWWRAASPLGALLALSGLLAVGLAVGSRRLTAVLGTTAVVLSVDLVLGAPLQLGSPAGYSALVAGRFAGLGNVAFGIYATACLLTTALLARKSWHAVLLGASAVLIVGAPAWGSDVGGVLALLPAFAVLGMLLGGARVSVVRFGLAGLAAAALVTILAFVDLARPAADRTHLGRFADDVRDGAAGELLQRKAEAVFALLFRSPVTALLPLVVALAVFLLLRPPPALQAAFHATPQLRQGLIAVGVASAVGFLVNDSGAAVPALALLLAVPAAVAEAARVASDSAARSTGGPGPVA